MEMTPELFGIIMDRIGSNMDPNNPFAGVGQAMGMSSLASKKAADLQEQDKSFWDKLIASLSGAEKPGPTSLNLTQGKNGLEFNLKGNDFGGSPGKKSGMGSMDFSSFSPTVEAPKSAFNTGIAGGTLTKTPDQTIDQLIKSVGGFEFE